MKKALLLLLLTASMIPAWSISDTETMRITAHYNKISTQRSAVFSILTTNNVDNGNSDITISNAAIGSLAETFRWNFSGTLYNQTAADGTLYSSMSVSYQFSPLQNGTNVIPMDISFEPNYTTLGSSYLGQSGATVGNVNYKDTQSWTTKTLSVDETAQTATATYTLTGTDNGLLWKRTGSVYVKLDQARANSAGAGTYVSTVTVTVAVC